MRPSAQLKAPASGPRSEIVCARVGYLVAGLILCRCGWGRLGGLQLVDAVTVLHVGIGVFEQIVRLRLKLQVLVLQDPAPMDTQNM